MITIDSREQGSIQLVQEAFRASKIPVSVEKLDYGDYRMDIIQDDGTPRTVLIERKTPTDFISSTTPTMRDPGSKIARQLNGCLDTDADVVVLLVDGYYQWMKGGKIKTKKINLQHSPDAFVSKLRTIQSHSIRVEYNPSDWYLPFHLLSLYKYESRSEHNTLALSPKPFAVPPRSQSKWTVLMGMRGVGPKMAQQLLTEFGSIKKLANSNKGTLMAVKGVGEKTAEEILWYLN
jgi:ERCC4-type nuclease|tara:strand:+ start:233 stop:934 length:702 start_codon:yes stop_codon:yes gene_type:complete